MNKNNNNHRDYLISLHNKRSIRALASALAVSICTFVALIGRVMINITSSNAEWTFHYFTNLSNLLSAAGAMFMIPYAVEGIRKKRFTLPRWVSLFQYMGAVSVFITMFFAATIIAPTQGIEFAYGGNQILLHLLIPILAIVLFLAVETNNYISKKETFISQIPFWIYCVVYTVMVHIIGKEKGGWTDMYSTKGIIPLWAVAIVLFSVGYGAAVVLRVLHNKMVDKEIAELSKGWTEDVTSVDLRIEAFGLGSYMAKHMDKTDIPIPIDIFELMSQKCDVSVEELIRAYAKGVENALAMREDDGEEKIYLRF